ncbi:MULTISPECIES: ABC transporter ATP-binding protein [Rhizobium/Agrobacterium group]|uniref:ATP-binding cassette domain-containing protein n=2 Tax=Rhizobium/Agrobacterium group TaxID=227290 RepID=A0A9X3R1T6_9HYPH|nr:MULTISPECIES: ATP-binding cassette domain-containing protein [Rhizobium/Agrobacterium group]MBO9126281.1 ATP-binding cassette domain-containing protein [Rhizobium sp. 16-488-2b]MBO9176865.1 ATP-binding cassette domain-containing protein [Rhizobium sp. 16-488-2a]MBO9197434.1 ATP-binding cassette domain-containing protein [Rhizobium sp. 16-449-1b]MCZ7466701.1 ATP-binding cassette domain-containing protein [Rhizobium rhizogenes]MCZ7939265.1 ATP-binding cassette domain-containing protein [Agrob
MIEIDGVTVSFGGVTALNRLTVQLDAPVVGIIGPNGAGKTTFLNVLSGFVRPGSGRIRVFGQELTGLQPHQRAQWGLRRSFQKEQAVDELTVEDNVRVVLDSLRLSRGDAEDALTRALEFTGINAVRRRSVAGLNSFERRMTELARCVAGSPKLILLDEPGAGFSQSEVATLRSVINGISETIGARTFLIDHDVDLIQATCQRTMVLDFGSLVTYGETASVLADPRVRAVYLGMEET